MFVNVDQLAWLDMFINFSKLCCIVYVLVAVVTRLVLLLTAYSAIVYRGQLRSS